MTQPHRLAATAAGWTVERLHGPASDLLAAPEPPDAAMRLVRIHTVTRPALVLGSTQSLDTADHVRAAAAGAEVVRRRSGGGAVLLTPGGQVWVDFFVAPSDPLWSDDIALAAQWVAELWAAVIEPLVAEPVTVHSGRLVADRWGRLVCFAGRGPGEVFAGELKVVGLSQRRNRRWTRLQTTARLVAPTADRAAPRRSLDELDLLDIAAQDRAAGREVMAARCGAVAAAEADVSGALLEALEARYPADS